MTTVVVTIYDQKGDPRDLELPADVPASMLSPALGKVFQSSRLRQKGHAFKGVLKLEGADTVIPPDRSLSAAGVVHGDKLRLLIKAIPSDLRDHEVGLSFTGPGFASAAGSTYPLRGKSMLIGRVDPAAGIVSKVLGVDLTELDDPDLHSVSRRHAQVLHRNGEYLLQDLKSTNGTYVNGDRLSPEVRVALNHGAEVRFGEVKLFFIWDSQEGSQGSR
jgi:hypothetical protein